MKLEYELNSNKLKISLYEVLIFNFKKSFFFQLFFSIIFGYFFSTNSLGEVNWTHFFVYTSIIILSLLFLFFLIPIIIFLLKLKNSNSKIHFLISDTNIVITNLNTFKKKEFNWYQVKKIRQLKTFDIIILRNYSYIPIPKNLADYKELNSKIKIKPIVGIPNLTYFISFIPIIGFIAGVLFLISGILKKTRKSILGGVFGILFTPFCYIALFSFIDNSLFFKQSNNEISQNKIYKIGNDLEKYKTKEGIYPENLEQLKKYDDFFDDLDPSSFKYTPWDKNQIKKIYYKKLSDNSFLLKSRGIDRILNTKDDITLQK